jgi:uncharacterized membrane protein YhaH (DUF805 family)
VGAQFIAGIVLTILIDTKKFQPDVFVSILFIGAGLFFWIAVIIARLRDADKPEWLSFIGMIPLLCFGLVFYLLVVPGSKGRNQHGPAGTGLFRN